MSKTLPRKCVTSAVIFTSGDALSQHVLEAQPWSKHDYARSARLAVHGGVGAYRTPFDVYQGVNH